MQVAAGWVVIRRWWFDGGGRAKREARGKCRLRGSSHRPAEHSCEHRRPGSLSTQTSKSWRAACPRNTYPNVNAPILDTCITTNPTLSTQDNAACHACLPLHRPPGRPGFPAHPLRCARQPPGPLPQHEGHPAHDAPRSCASPCCRELISDPC